MRRFNAATAQIVQWDDHEVRDNWYPTRDLSADDASTRMKSMALHRGARPPGVPRVQPGRRPARTRPAASTAPSSSARWSRCSRSICAAIADRTARTARPTLDEASAFAGPAQIAWLKARLAASRATWKVIASDMPIGAVVPDAPSYFEAFANGDDGPPLGRELELADLLRFMQGAADPQRRLGHRGHPLLRRPSLPSDPREVHRVRSVLGVRRRSAQRRHVRPEQDGCDVRPRGRVHRHPAGHEGGTGHRATGSSSSAGCTSIAAPRR